MKHIAFLCLFALLGVTLVADLGPFEPILRDIHRQSAQWAGSPSHTAHVPTRDRDYGVGDQDTFWRWNLSVMPPTWVQESATCRAVGEHCYVFVADNAWNTHMTQANVDTVMTYLEETTLAGADYGAIEMDTLAFGPIPDELDDDPKLIVYYTALGSFSGTSFDGYFSAYNQVTEAEAQQMNPAGHSNECEMIYMTCHPLDPIDPIRISVLAHELQHLIHWGADIDEETWVDEGCAELAMVLFGMPDPITGFNTNPDNDLTEWDNSTFSSYVKVMLFFTYLYERFGGNFTYNVVQEQANGVAGIEAQLAAHQLDAFVDVFTDWAIANYLDDPALGDGAYGYELLDIPHFHTQEQHASFPASASGAVQQWAAEYVRLSPGEDISLDLVAQADDDFTMAVIVKGEDPADTEVTVHSGSNLYPLTLDFIDSEHQNISLAFTGLAQGIDYEYTVDPTVSVDDGPLPETPLALTVGPNPLTDGAVRFSLSQAAPDAQIEVFDIRGRLVRSLAVGELQWDGRNARGEPAPTGVYLYRVQAAGRSFAGKLLIAR